MVLERGRGSGGGRGDGWVGGERILVVEVFEAAQAEVETVVEEVVRVVMVAAVHPS